MASSMLPTLSSSLLRASSVEQMTKMFAAGRWYPQPQWELSHHRSRPPNPGIMRKTRLIVVDNSQIGREASECGRLGYVIHVYRPGYRKGHMPKATLGTKVLLAIQGQMYKGYIVGATTQVEYRKHGVPSTDTNNVVLIDREQGNPIGKKVIAPIPSWLLRKRRDDVGITKVLAMATKFF